MSVSTNDPDFLASQATLTALIAGFENGSWPGAKWTHAAHLTLGACYILEGNSALHRLRAGIPRYNVSQGGKNTEDSGYHETLTCFWAAIIRDFIAASQFPTTFAAVQPRGLFDATVLQYGQQRKLHEEYYSFDVVADRREWIPPLIK